MNKETQSLRVLYKNLFTRLKELIINPTKAWNEILEEKTQVNEILAQFSLPLIGAYTLATFVGYLFSHQGWAFNLSLRDAVFTFSSCFFGLYLGWFILTKLLPTFGLNESKETIFKLVAYPSMVIYLVGTLNRLVPETYFFAFLQLFAGYIVWKGIEILNVSTKESKLLHTIVITLILLLLPYAIGEVLFRLSPI